MGDAAGARILDRLKHVVTDLSGVELEEISEHSTFLELGFDSLFLTQLATGFHKEFGVKITFRQLFDDLPTLSALARHIAVVAPAPTVEPAPRPAEVCVAPRNGHGAHAAPLASPGGEANPAVAPMALAPGRALTAPPDPGPGSFAGEESVGPLQAVIAQQLDLMSQQLVMLRALHGAAPSAAPAAPLEMGAASPPATSSAGSAPAPSADPAPAGGKAEPAAASMPSGFGPQVSNAAAKLRSPAQQRHLDDLIRRYCARTATSKRLAQQYRQCHADPRTAAGWNRLWKEMVYPIVVTRSSGSRLWDADGNEYIDLLNGFGPNFLGHSPPFVAEALRAQLERGFEVGPQTPLAGETAALLCELTGMDRASFVNTGSEAVQAAIRLARTVTGRNKIALFAGDYHGNFDEVLVRGTGAAGRRRTLPLAPGIPLHAVEDVLVLDYGTEEALDAIRAQATDIAVVLVEPVQSRRPDFLPREFLHALRRLTAETGIVLVFDEVITGFRMCPGGAQQYFGVEADLATYGKIVGGGMPIGVVAGRSRLMDTFDGGMWQYGDDSFPASGVTFFAGTFVRHPLAIAAAHAALTYLRSAGPALQEGVNRRAARFVAAVNEIFDAGGIKVHIASSSSQMYIKVQEESELATLLFFHLRLRGVHLLEGFPTYMTAAHTDADVDTLVEAFRDSVRELQEAGIFPGAAAPRPLVEGDGAAFPLAEPQREIWMGSQLGEAASCAFNESDTISLEGPLDVAALRAAVALVLARHQALHLRFDEDGATQHEDRAAPVEVALLDLSGGDGATREARLDEVLARAALEPFDLTAGPLVRVRIVRLAAERHLLVVHAHHLVFDGWSAEVVVREIGLAYSARCAGQAPALPAAVPYRDYVAWSEAFRTEPGYEEAMRFWERVLRPELPAALDLPTDRPRPATRSYRGGTVHHVVAPEIYASFRTTCQRLGVTLYVALLSAFEVLLSRLTTQQDLVVGVPAAGQAAFGQDVVGYCVNLLPLRGRVEGHRLFSEFARATRALVLDAFEHQRVSLGDLVRRFEVPRDPTRLPLVEVVFNCSRYFAGVEFTGLRVTSHENRRQAVYHDLFLNAIESGGQLVIDWDYNADLFDADTLERWIGHLEVLLGAIAAEPNAALDDLPIMTADDAAALSSEWGRPGAITRS